MLTLAPFPVILSANNLSKHFGDTVALDGVTCDVDEGATGLLGPNGAGKTTLLRILLGLLPADGQARVLGLDPMRQPREVRARLGYMPESECIIPGIFALDVVAFMGRLAGMPRRDAFKRAHEVLYYVGLGEERYREATEYSLGMQQRLKLATALVHDPEVLFLDEPTNGLDPAGRTEVLTLIRELATGHGKNVIFSSHLLKDVEMVCRRVIVLNRGKVAETTDVEQKRTEEPRNFELKVEGDGLDRFRAALAAAGAKASGDGEMLVELPAGSDTAPIFRAAVEAGVRVRGLKPTRRSLEDVFMAAVGAPDEG